MNVTPVVLRSLAVLLVSVLWCRPVSASWDLWEVYRLALLNDPAYRSEQLRHDAVSLDGPIAEAAWHGSVSVAGRLGYRMTDDTPHNNWEDHEDHLLELRAEVPVYDRVLRTEVHQSEAAQSASAMLLRQSHQQLILRVAQRYLDVLAAQDRREVARVDIIAIRRQLDLTSERLEVGLGTQADLFDARARLKQAEANAIQADNLHKVSISLLGQVIGQPPQALAPLLGDAPLSAPQPALIDEWTAQAATSNLDVRTKTLELKVAEFEVKKLQDATYPRVTAGGSRSVTVGKVGSKTSDAASVYLQVSIPVFTGGLSLRSERAGIEYNRAHEALDHARRQALAETTTAYLDVTGNISQVEALREAITAGESALSAKQEGFNAGLTTNLDVLDAQRNLSQSRTDYLNARYSYILSLLALEQAIGDLDQSDIQRVNQWLDRES
ncbi:MAG: TolC family outer membrane protein [Gammaproteobacteria bacterium]|nr:TolC family outer membrane protein [Gammaproteobacteria bacterium]MYD77142.1 TolC family outer membrane protein [Gammaproteobacteria bacterium]MYJ52892.1 TolC family outer membrane protein [Gammaproteobacteria bacterium]